MRLIDADALYETLCHVWDRSDSEEFEHAVFKVIANDPTIDAVPVVRCKACKFSDVYQSDSSGATAMYCRAFTFHRMVAEDDYCSYGERREP